MANTTSGRIDALDAVPAVKRIVTSVYRNPLDDGFTLHLAAIGFEHPYERTITFEDEILANEAAVPAALRFRDDIEKNVVEAPRA